MIIIVTAGLEVSNFTFPPENSEQLKIFHGKKMKIMLRKGVED